MKEVAIALIAAATIYSVATHERVQPAPIVISVHDGEVKQIGGQGTPEEKGALGKVLSWLNPLD